MMPATRNLDYQWGLVEEAGDNDNFNNDSMIQERVLPVLYTKHKCDPREPRLGSIHLARLTGCPHEMKIYESNKAGKSRK